MKSVRFRWPDWVWVALPICGVFAAFFACVLNEQLWLSFGVLHLEPYFADTVVILAANDAKVAGIDPYLSATGFDYLGRPHVYGPLWLELYRFGLTRADYVWLGGGLAAVAVTASALWCRPRGLRAALMCLALLASPAALLGYERANNDLVVLVLFLVAALAMQRPTWVRMSMAAVTLMLVALLKFYPLVAMPMLAVGSRRWRAVVCGMGAVCLLCLFAWMQREEFARAIQNMPTEVTPLGYGAKVVALLWAHPVLPQVSLSSGFAMGIGFWLWFGWREKRDPIPLGNRAAGFVAGALAWAFCFFANGNYSYRALLLILPAGAWSVAAQTSGPRESRNAWLALSGLMITLWLAQPHVWMNRVSNTAELWTAGVLLGLENGSAWGISIFLICISLRVGIASWRGSSWARLGHSELPKG